MKRLLIWLWGGSPLRGTLTIALLFAGVVFAAAYGGGVVGPYQLPVFMKGGFFAGSAATADTANRISTMKRCTLVYDMPPVGGSNDPLDTYCAESAWGATCTGVVFGDQLMLGIDQVLPSAFGNIDAYVSAAGAVKVRACADGVSDAGTFNMPDASYTILWVH